MHKIIQTEVLVIGGGVAGETAALECSKRGLKTLVVVKSLLGKSGCSIFAGNLMTCPGDNSLLQIFGDRD